MMKKIGEYDDFDLLNPHFFSTLISNSSIQWNLTNATLGQGYLERSGDKYPSPIMRKLYEKDELNAETMLVKIILAKYEDNWIRLKKAMIDTDYNPIENYNMNEKKLKDEQTTTFGKTISDAESASSSKTVDDDSIVTYGKQTQTQDDHTTTRTGSETDDHSITEDDVTVTPGITTTVESDVYGYNSSTDVPSDKKVESKTGHDTQSHTLDESTTRTYTNVKDDYDGTATATDSGHDDTTRDISETGSESRSRDYEEGGSEKVEHEYEFERTGNIGTLTTQAMLTSEIGLRQWAWLDQVYADIDKVIALQTY